MADQPLTAREFEEILKRMGGGLGGASRGTSTAGAGSGATGNDLKKDLQSLGQQAKDVEANIKKLNKQFLPFSGSLQTAREAQSQLERDINGVNEKLKELDTALDTGRLNNEKINDATRESLQIERDKLRAVKATVDFEAQKQATIKTTFTSLEGIGAAYQKIALAAVAGMSAISGAVQQGGTGFNLLGAAAEFQADMAKAQADMGAGALRSVGQSMEGLGTAGRLAGGALSFLAQAAEHNAQLRREAARMRNQLFMNMGDKFSKSFMTAGAAGAQFTKGATGMNEALAGSRILLQDFGEMVKRNREAFTNSGMSAEEMTKRIGATSAAFKKSGIDNQLMRLGLDYQKQSDIIAETVGSLGELATVSGAPKATQAETERATLLAAKAQVQMASIMGEEYEGRKKAARAEAMAASSQLAMAELTEKYGAGFGQNAKLFMESMDPNEAKAIKEMLASGGQVVDAGLNVMMSQSPAMAKKVQEMYLKITQGQLKDGNTEYLDMKKKYTAQELRELKNMRGIVNASTLTGNAGVAGAVTKGVEQQLAEGKKFTDEQIAAAQKSGQKLEDPKPEPPKDDPLGNAIVDAADTMNKFQKKMENYVVDNIPVWSAAMQSSLKGMEDAFKGVVTGLNPLADKFGWLTDFLAKYGMALQLAITALPLFSSGLKFLKAGMEKFGAMREMKSLKAESDVKTNIGKDGKERYFKDGKRISADEASKIKSMEAPGGKTGGGMMSKLGGVAKVAGGLMAFANVATTAFSAFETQQAKQAEYDQAKAAGDKKAMAAARADQGEAVGGAVGSVAGGAIGLMLGGPIGAAVGSYLGEMAGGALGKYIGPYWDEMSAKAGQMWESTKQSFAQGWDNAKKIVSDLLVSLGQGILSVGKEVFAFFGQVGNFIWSAIKKTPLFQMGTLIWDSIAKTDIGKKMIGIFTSVTDFFKGLIDGLFTWVKGALGNLVPDGIKNIANKIFGGDDKPSATSKPDASSKPPEQKPSAPAKPTAGPNGEKLIKMPDGRVGYGSADTGKFYPLNGDKMGAAEDYKAAYNKAAPKSPSPTTNAPAQGNQTGSKQGEGKKDQTTPPPPTAEKKVSGAVPEVKTGGQVTEKDMPRIMADNLKLQEYLAKQNARMIDMMAAVAENTKRTTSATEKMARNG